ncbi:AAA domain-containing protein [Thermoflavimicrobium daqui]|uniref:Uncharacterized protein n=1 Tax=Thermoflavimicrobium daqui TaxID=2137476 RepID=A0A364K9G5_9BACL|nr:AAA domain-containing protein [Thermoflavimicrobium daqui]RAL26935.1 hypothetical protein DL897_02505 [Thermoflavimicrobium daqui]
MEQKLIRLKDRLSDISQDNRAIRLIKLYHKWAFDITDLTRLRGADFLSYFLEEIRKPNALIPLLKQTDASHHADPIDKNLLSLYRNCKQLEEETGIYDLAVGYPFLSGTLEDGTFIQAPLFLYPVRLVRCQSNPIRWELYRQETEPQLNRALFLALKQFHQCSIDETIFEDVDRLARLEGNTVAKWASWLKEYQVDVTYEKETIQPFDVYSKSTLPNQKLEIKPHLILASFPQGNSSILHDYQRLLQSTEVKTHPIVSSLMLQKPTGKKADISDAESTDPFYLLPTDRSQEAILAKVRTETAVVVNGPPGTGKSQLITNLITDALSQTKKVLVISTKRTALDTVYTRLEKLGISPYVALIHDEKKDRKALYQKIHQLITKFYSNIPNYEPFLRKLTEKIDEHEQKLNEVYKALHEVQAFGLSAYELYSQAKHIDSPILVSDIAYSIHTSQLNKITQTISRYSNYYEKFSQERYVFKERRSFAGLTSTDFEQLNESLEVMIAKAKNSINKLDELNNPDITPQFLWSIAKKLEQIPIKLKPEDLSLWEKTKLAWWTNFQGKKLIQELSDSLPPLKNQSRTWEQTSQQVLLMGKIAQITSELNKDLLKLEKIFPSSQVQKLQEQLAKGNIPLKELENIRKCFTDDFHQVKDMDQIYENTTPIIRTLIERLQEVDTKKEFPLSKVWNQIVIQSLYQFWIQEIEQKYPILTMISNGEIEQVRIHYRQLLAEKRDLATKVLRSDLQYGTNQLLNRYPRDVKELREQTGKQKRTWPTRKLIHHFAHRGLLEILPVWLVSPETVSSIFPLLKECFDLLIIDEANQCPFEQSIPAIFRSKQVVVIGDDKQLINHRAISTTFEETEAHTESSESLFYYACEAFNKSSLLYHYRSQAEELIHFSNHGFYQGKLQIAPNVHTNLDNPAISWDKHENENEEAKKVVILLNQLLKSHPDKSIGIITFHPKQKETITELIETMLKTNNHFSTLYNRAIEEKIDERIFIKTVEQTQGDVRDFIIFSMGYLKNEKGKVQFYFDTLGLEDGEHYLNIAITRAREHLYVLSSIEPEDIELSSTDHQGPIYLKHFLEYAKAVHRQNKDQVDHILWKINGTSKIKRYMDTPFENQLQTALSRLGYTVVPKVGSSSYTIDLGIVHPEDPHRYILGIECDGAMYHSTSDTKEREVDRHIFLERRGWKIKRVWSRNWWQNPEAVIEEIEEAIDQYLRPHISNGSRTPYKESKQIDATETQEQKGIKVAHHQNDTSKTLLKASLNSKPSFDPNKEIDHILSYYNFK